jgi:uncharacterized membrane protein HdeD (DUF308 family)
MPQTWLWAFPLSYVLHIVEETFAGEGFYRWIARINRRRMPRPAFLRANAALLTLMVVVVALSWRGSAAPTVGAALGTITLANGVGHLVGTLAARAYSPGLISGLFLWVPLGTLAVASTRGPASPTAWAAGVLLGLLVTALVAALGLSLSQRETRSTPGGTPS